jgi:hypothetical protein|nr:MAG TPA: Baseplate wedge protein [Caudoviricetes sp.]
MPQDNTYGTYHLADNPALYDPMRNNTFEFVVTGLDKLLRVGADGSEENAYITNAQEVLRLSVDSASIPMFTQEVIPVKRGNSTIKFAGTPSFASGSLVVNDWIGADSKSALMAWQNLSYNVKTDRVGNAADYKKDCWLIEYTPDYTKQVRQWQLKGCFISGLSEDAYSMSSDGKKTISATIEYDRAIMSLPD